MDQKILHLLILILFTTTAVKSQYFITLPQKTDIKKHSISIQCPAIQPGLSLDFHKVGLRRIESNFADSPHVSSLSLEDNQIEYVSPSAFQLLPNLLRLSLARNNISLVNFTQLDGHPNLRSLNLDENLRLSNDDNNSEEDNIIINFVNNFPCLQHLHLRNNHITEIKSLKFAPSLTHLYLSSNTLVNSKLNFISDVSNTLEHLDLSESGVRGLSLENQTTLRDLGLEGNRIARVCGRPYCRDNDGGGLSLSGASSLLRLSLARNEITSLESDAFDGTPLLVHLDLSYNRIDAVRKETFETVERLRNLTLRDNMIKEMPDLTELRELEFLSLANNKLGQITNSSFSQMNRLRFLDLSGNMIESIEAGAFGSQANLEMLKLSNNRLRSMPVSWLQPLMNLKILYMNGNKIENLDDLKLGGVKYFARLERVHLQNNSITAFRLSSFKNTLKPLPNITLEFFDVEEMRKNKRDVNDKICRCNCGKSFEL